MAEAMVAQKGPFPVDVVEGKTYFWCACGRSNRQPFCDGSHKVTTFSPVQFRADATKTVYFCGCKHTGSQPMCDGTHNSL